MNIFLAAIGLTVPGFTRRMPWLAPLAAAGLMIVMIGAVVLHVQRREVSSAITTAILFALLTFVAYQNGGSGRFCPFPQLRRRSNGGQAKIETQ